MNKLPLAALAAVVGYIAGIAGPALGQGAVQAAVDLELAWSNQITSAMSEGGIIAAPLAGEDQLIASPSKGIWSLVRRGASTPDNLTGRLVTCEVDIPGGTVRLRDLAGEYSLRVGGVPTVTWAPAIPAKPVIPSAPRITGEQAATEKDRRAKARKAARMLAGIAERGRPDTAGQAARACDTRRALREFHATAAGKLQSGEGYGELRLRCSRYLRARGFDGNACFSASDSNPHSVCPIPD